MTFWSIAIITSAQLAKENLSREESAIEIAYLKSENNGLQNVIADLDAELAKVTLERDELQRQWNNIQNMKVVSFANLDMIRQGAQNKLL